MANTTDPSGGRIAKGGWAEPNMYAGWVIQPSSPPYFSSTFAPVFELLFDLGRLVLVHIGLDLLGSALDEVLRFLEAQTGDRTDFLDHVDFLVASARQNDRELGLFRSGGGSRATGGRARGHGNRSGSRDTPLFLEKLREVRGFQDSEARQFFHKLFDLRHFLRSFGFAFEC